ncbi:Holliday junction resolvase RecU [Desemzia sp. RIT804]|uniref:Holliday junction resolvase RecU n=1 Tax=Desemzia sp. RIT 804 TaxID=2810209 RepID=UPI0019504FF6|nr:Holliday junction resolvase RecU [Desemzia sp. RIT 804]MBM6613739.1 Holliday junction resolvase RecU [Desemzia sp. RIT 804]
MVVNYPNGKHYAKPEIKRPPQKKTRNLTTFSNRGMSLEDDINDSNISYLRQERAVIHKKPTPIQIVNVDYPKRSAAVIKEAYFRQASTTDYNGVYRGLYLDFEAKETKNKLSFPLKNFHQHQITHMHQCLKQKGICFVILRFSSTNRLFLLEAKQLLTYWEKQADGRKSIPVSELEKVGYEMYYGFSPRIPYLDVVDQLIDQSLSNI